MMNLNLSYALDVVRCDALAKFNPDEDVTKIADITAIIEKMSCISRKEGLLALSAEFPQYSKDPAYDSIVIYDDEFEVAVNYVVDGTDPVNLEEILVNRYWANQYQNNAALECYIIIRGILLIQAGANPYIMREWIKSVLPKQVFPVYEEYVTRYAKEWNEKRDAEILEQYKAWQPIPLQSNAERDTVQQIEDKVLSLTSSDWFKVSFNINHTDLADSIAIFSEEGRNEVLSRMSEATQISMKAEISKLTSRDKEKIAKATDKILYAIWFEETGGLEARIKEAGL